MIRDILRTIGAGCLLAGGILYFTTSSEVKDSPHEKAQGLQSEVDELRSELIKTKEALATAQLSSTVKENVPKAKGKDTDATTDDVSSSGSVSNTILIIEPGSNSAVVSATLERLGIIKDATLFDVYLADNNLTGKIQIGEHKVDSSMDFQTIAQKISKSK